MTRKKGFYSISAVAKMFSVHQQTIRLYEKQGLINPKRSDGNTRLFSEGDVDLLEEIIYLTHQLGINLAGVEMIFKLKGKIKKLQNDMNKVFEQTQKDLDENAKTSKEAVKTSVNKLLLIKKESSALPESESENLVRYPDDNANSWQIEYDDD